MGDEVSPVDAADALNALTLRGVSEGRITYAERGAILVLQRHAHAVAKAAPGSAGNLLPAWESITHLAGCQGASVGAVVDRVAVLADATPATGGEPERQTRAPEGVTPFRVTVGKIEDGAITSAPIVARPDVEFRYAGEFTDPDQTPVTASMSSCQTCGALVADGEKETHRRWHRGERNE